MHGIEDREILCSSYTPEQESANYGMQANSCLPLVYVNKVFLEHSQAYLFMYCLQQQSLVLFAKPKYCCLAHYRKGLLTPTLETATCLNEESTGHE